MRKKEAYVVDAVSWESDQCEETPWNYKNCGKLQDQLDDLQNKQKWLIKKPTPQQYGNLINRDSFFVLQRGKNLYMLPCYNAHIHIIVH